MVKLKLALRPVASHGADRRSYNEDPDRRNDEGTLFERFEHHLAVKRPGGTVYCHPERPLRERERHLSALPAELLLRVLRWVASDELDLRQLDLLAAVCRGFYVLARDPDLWRSACQRIWGEQLLSGANRVESKQLCDSAHQLYPYWRQMFLNRPHLFFNGLYISKTSYIRKGEDCGFLSSDVYQRWHMVVYYRYLRFFSNGTVLMFTTADEPELVVQTLLSAKTCHPSTLIGSYQLLEPDRIAAVMRYCARGLIEVSGSKRQNVAQEMERSLEWRIESTKQRRHCRLQWLSYTVANKRRSGSDVGAVCNFTLTDSAFPPLYFSRVRSYSARSIAPL